MKKIIFFVLLIMIQISYSQDIVSEKEIYFSKEGLAYKKTNNLLFDGIIQWTKKKGKHITQESFFENGRIIRSITYFNIYDKQAIAEETIYNKETLLKEKSIKNNIEGNISWITFYDKNEKKSLYEIYENDKITYSCEYLDGKKNGKELCYDKKGNEVIVFFENGKQINK